MADLDLDELRRVAQVGPPNAMCRLTNRTVNLLLDEVEVLTSQVAEWRAAYEELEP